MERAACAILVRDGKILLGRRSLRSRSYPGCWDLIGGHCEGDETLEETLERELAEELGVVMISSRLIGIIPEPRPELNGEARYHLFEVTAWEGAPTMSGGEHSELRWFRLADACSLPDLALAAYASCFRRIMKPI